MGIIEKIKQELEIEEKEEIKKKEEDEEDYKRKAKIAMNVVKVMNAIPEDRMVKVSLVNADGLMLSPTRIEYLRRSGVFGDLIVQRVEDDKNGERMVREIVQAMSVYGVGGIGLEDFFILITGDELDEDKIQVQLMPKS